MHTEEHLHTQEDHTSAKKNPPPVQVSTVLIHRVHLGDNSPNWAIITEVFPHG